MTKLNTMMQTLLFLKLFSLSYIQHTLTCFKDTLYLVLSGLASLCAKAEVLKVCPGTPGGPQHLLRNP